MQGSTISPAQPAASARRAWAMPSSVVYSATPDNTGTRSPTASTAARSTNSFSSADNELFSPRVPSMIRPVQPASRQAAACRCVLTRSSPPSAVNSVINAGNRPCQLGRIVTLPVPHGLPMLLPAGMDTG